MSSHNDITGDHIFSKRLSKDYEDNFGNIFGDKQLDRYEKYVAWSKSLKRDYLPYDKYLEDRGQEPSWTKHEWDEFND